MGRTFVHLTVGAAVAASIALGTAASGAAPPARPTERVDPAIYQMCMATINPTRAQVLAMPNDQRTELLTVENWCQRLAVRTNVLPH